MFHVCGYAERAAALALGLLMSPHGVAHADTVNLTAVEATETVDGVDYPVCHTEDGSDLDPSLLPCIWTNGKGEDAARDRQPGAATCLPSGSHGGFGS